MADTARTVKGRHPRVKAWGGHETHSTHTGAFFYARKETAMRPNQHAPIPHYYPGTLESPEELTVYCTCGEWEFESIASAGGPCDTAWQADFAAHANEEAFD